MKEVLGSLNKNGGTDYSVYLQPNDEVVTHSYLYWRSLQAEMLALPSYIPMPTNAECGINREEHRRSFGHVDKISDFFEVSNDAVRVFLFEFSIVFE